MAEQNKNTQRIERMIRDMPQDRQKECRNVIEEISNHAFMEGYRYAIRILEESVKTEPQA